MKPGTAAALCGKINLGDVLESVDGSVRPLPGVDSWLEMHE
jgi:hypothetical protein